MKWFFSRQRTLTMPYRQADFHYNGVRTNTSLAAIADEADTENFFSMFYQLDTGDIRLSTYFPWNETWQIYGVTNSAMHGTSLAAVAPETEDYEPGYKPYRSYVFYLDDTGTVQELGQAHNWKDWEAGSLGDLGLKANIDPTTSLTAGFQAFNPYYDNSHCPNHIQAKWLMYWPRGEDFVQEVFWDDLSYEWYEGEKFEGLDPYSGIVTMVTESYDTLVRRLFGIGKDGRLNHWYCADCCVNTTGLWMKGTYHTYRDSFLLRMLSDISQAILHRVSSLMRNHPTRSFPEHR